MCARDAQGAARERAKTALFARVADAAAGWPVIR
jgi:hypothetical protein